MNEILDLFKQVEILQRFEKLIQNEKTGNPQNLSNRLRVSRSQLYRLIGILKDYGAPIDYNRTKETFFYKHPYRININFTLENLSEEDVKYTEGGSFFSKFCFSPFFATERFYIC